MLKNEETKIDKKIFETQLRASKIFEIKKMNEESYLQKLRLKQQQEEEQLLIKEKNQQMRESRNFRKNQSGDALLKMKMEQYYIKKQQAKLRQTVLGAEINMKEQDKRANYSKIRSE